MTIWLVWRGRQLLLVCDSEEAVNQYIAALPRPGFWAQVRSALTGRGISATASRHPVRTLQ